MYYCSYWLSVVAASSTIVVTYSSVFMYIPKDCTTIRDHLKMASNTESDFEDDVTEEVEWDVVVVESVNAKGKSKESAVRLHFEKWTEERAGLNTW